MKTIKYLGLLLPVFVLSSLNAQEIEQSSETLNKWTVELNAGSTGFNTLGQLTIMKNNYFSDTFTPFHVNIGARYMASSIFGFKGSLSYDNIKNADDSNKFDATYIGLRGELVFNLGKFFQFNQFTKRFGLLAHGGVGISRFYLDEKLTNPGSSYSSNKVPDYIMTGLAGLTIPVRLTDKLSFNIDGTLIAQGRHDYGLAGFRNGDGGIVDATLFNATIGFAYSLGSGSKHIDWSDYKEEMSGLNTPNTTSETEDLKNRLATLEAANNKGVDMSAIQRMINEKAGNNTQKQQDIAKELINNAYIASYFDYNVAKPTNESTEGIDFVLNYLRKNPTSNIVVTGFADEKGGADYNNKLALKRAENVKTTLEKGGINASRITVASGGQDKTVDIDSEWARNTVRKVLFKVQ